MKKPKVKDYTKTINYNCTVTEMARQLNVPLYKVMLLGVYFKRLNKP